jgi:hypothetical protein
MADPVLVPPTPVINQGDSPEEVARVTQNVMDIFDKVAPPMGADKPERPPAQPPASPPSEPLKPPETPKAPEETIEPRKVPGFIEQSLKGETPAAPTPAPSAAADEPFPEEMPILKNPEEVKQKYHTWRDKYKELKEENKRLRERPALDDGTNQKLSFLEEQNKKLVARVSQFDVEANQEFQQKVLAPLTHAWNEAAGIIKDAGGDPNELAKALTLSGKAQFEALDEIFIDLPESAKAEAHNALSTYRRYDDLRRKALANAPQTAMALRKSQLEAQMKFIEGQKQEMGSLFEEAVRKLRDEAGVEVLRKSDDPEAKWWNDEADDAINTSKNLYLDNTDLRRMAFACVLAPLADKYRKLWAGERQERLKLQELFKDKYGSEPTVSESGGNTASSPTSLSEDLKRPFTDVFLEKFHQLRSQGR